MINEGTKIEIIIIEGVIDTVLINGTEAPNFTIINKDKYGKGIDTDKEVI